MMKFKQIVAAVALSASLFSFGGVTAGTLVLDPSASNGSLGAIDPGTGEFSTTGGVLLLGTADTPSVLTITGNTGAQLFTETGTVYIDYFTNGPTNDPVGEGDYSIYGQYSISGAGAWVTPTTYSADAASLSFTMTLFALTSTDSIITLGTASLVDSFTNYAIALLSGVPLFNTTGAANTVLGATLAFTPADAQLTGADGFFGETFLFNINVGAIGGNSGNTTYSVDGAGVVTITTPTGQNSPSTGNFTITNNVVPEPGMLALFGVGLAGLGMSRRRKN